MVPDISNPFWAEITRAIQARLEPEGYFLVLGNTDWSEERQTHYLDLVRAGRFDGVIANSVTVDIGCFEGLSVPVVMIGERAEGGRMDVVGSETYVEAMPLIETAKGVCNAASIAFSSRRNVAICFGAEDYRRDLGVERSPDESETFVARSLIAMAAKAAGIGAQDSVFSNVDDEAGLEASTRTAKSLGFTGKGIVHPRQIAVVHRVFDPSEAEVEAARRVVEALDVAKREGKGVASLDGKMVDAPVAERARRLIARADAASRPGRPE